MPAILPPSLPRSCCGTRASRTAQLVRQRCWSARRRSASWQHHSSRRQSTAASTRRWACMSVGALRRCPTECSGPLDKQRARTEVLVHKLSVWQCISQQPACWGVLCLQAALQLAQWMAETGQAAQDEITGSHPPCGPPWFIAALRPTLRLPCVLPCPTASSAACLVSARGLGFTAVLPSRCKDSSPPLCLLLVQACSTGPSRWSPSPRLCSSTTRSSWMR